MKTNFKVEDKVFDIRFGYGKITFIYSTDWDYNKDRDLVCAVKFDNNEEVHYTKEVALKLLSFTEYTLKGFNQKHKVDYSQYIDKWCKFKDNDEDEYFYVCRLKSIDERGNFYDDGDVCWEFCEPFSEDEIKILNLD